MSNPWRVMHSYSRSDPLAGRAGLAPGTTRRVLAFAKPHRRALGWFLLLVVLDAFLVVATPLLFRDIIDEEIERLTDKLGTERIRDGRFSQARALFFELATADTLADFLTSAAYTQLDDSPPIVIA